ncbi:MAG TPA: NAD(P)/FAD-dependent oxidoreductase [Vicinamibacteria bacterium]
MSVADVDALVIGGGPAGLSAAVELRRRGAGRVLVLDREPSAGGIPRDCRHPGFGWADQRRVLSGPAYARRLARLAHDARVEVWTESAAVRWTADRRVEVTTPRGLFPLSGRAVLLATGCRERPRPARLVPGDRPAGVLTTGALQRLVHATGERAGARAVVVGAEHVSFSAVHTLRASGTEVAAVVTEWPRHQTYAPLRWLAAGARGVPVLAGSEVTRVVGRGRVEAVEIASRDGATRRIDCDTVVFTGDWIPEHELARLRGLALDPVTRGPAVDTAFRTSATGVFAAGNLLHGAEAADHAAVEGRACGAAMARYLVDPGAGWRPAAEVRVQTGPTLLWIVPGLIAGGGERPPAFVTRAASFGGRGAVEVRQDGRLLHRKRFRSLVPNRSIHVASGWLADVNPGGGPVSVAAVLARESP